MKLKSINAFLVSKQGLMECRPNKNTFGLTFWAFWLGQYVKAKRGEEKK